MKIYMVWGLNNSSHFRLKGFYSTEEKAQSVIDEESEMGWQMSEYVVQ